MSRFYQAPDEDHQPLTWVQGRPLYAVHVIVAGLALSIIATSLLGAFGADAFLEKLVFDSEALFSGQVWRAFTYGFVNFPSIRIAVDIALLLWFGQDVERFFGRRVFLRLYALIYFIPPLLLSAFGLWHPMMLAGQTGALAVFVAFATLYPATTVTLNILASWGAAILVGVYSLMAISGHAWAILIALWGTTAWAHIFVRHQQGRLTFSLPRFHRGRAALAEAPRHPVAAGATVRISSAKTSSAPASFVPRPVTSDDMTEVDALLDKINRSGLESLTPREHERLAAAQARLARRYEQQPRA